MKTTYYLNGKKTTRMYTKLSADDRVHYPLAIMGI